MVQGVITVAAVAVAALAAKSSTRPVVMVHTAVTDESGVEIWSKTTVEDGPV